MPTIRVPGVNTAPAVEPQSLPTGGAGLEGQAIRQGAAMLADALDATVVQPQQREDEEQRRERERQDALRTKTDLKAFELELNDQMNQAAKDIEAVNPTVIDREAFIEEKLKLGFDAVREDYLSRPGLAAGAREVLDVAGANLRETARQNLDQVYEGREQQYRVDIAQRQIEITVQDVIEDGNVDLLMGLEGALEGTSLEGTEEGRRAIQVAARNAVDGVLVQNTSASRVLAERLVMSEDDRELRTLLGAGYNDAVQKAMALERTRAESELVAMQNEQATVSDLAERPWAAMELWDEGKSVQDEANTPYFSRLFGPAISAYKARVDQMVLSRQSVAQAFQLGNEILRGDILSDGSPEMIEAADMANRAAGGLDISSPDFPDAVVSSVIRAGGMMPSLGAQIAQAWNSPDPEAAMTAARAIKRVMGNNDQLLSIPSAHADSVSWIRSKFSDEQIARMVLATDLDDLGIDPATAINSARSKGAADRDGSAWASLAEENEKWLVSKASKWFSTDVSLTASFREDWNKLARAYHQGGLMSDEQAREQAWRQTLQVSHYLNSDGTLTKGDPRLRGQWALDELKNDAIDVGYTREEVERVTFVQQVVRGKEVYVGRFEDPDGNVRILQRDPEDPTSGPLYMEINPQILRMTAKDSTLGGRQLIDLVEVERKGFEEFQQIVQRNERFRELYAAGKLDWPFFGSSKVLPGERFYPAMDGGSRYNAVQSELRDMQDTMQIPRGSRNYTNRVKSAYLGMRNRLVGEIDRARRARDEFRKDFSVQGDPEFKEAADAIDNVLKQFERLEKSLGDSGNE